MSLASATRKVFGDLALIQHCPIHKRRNLKRHPARLRDGVDAQLRGAFADPDPHSGLGKAKRLAAELDKKTHPTQPGR